MAHLGFEAAFRGSPGSLLREPRLVSSRQAQAPVGLRCLRIHALPGCRLHVQRLPPLSAHHGAPQWPREPPSARLPLGVRHADRELCDTVRPFRCVPGPSFRGHRYLHALDSPGVGHAPYFPAEVPDYGTLGLCLPGGPRDQHLLIGGTRVAFAARTSCCADMSCVVVAQGRDMS